MNVDLFFYRYFNFLRVKIDINEKWLNLKSPEGSKAFKTLIPATWLAMWQHDFEFDVIWTAF